MLLLKIKNIVSWKPRPWPEGETAIPEEGQYITRFIGDHPDNPEQGSVIIDVAILDGNFDNISSMHFLNEDPSLCRLVNFEKKGMGGYRVELEFSTVFHHGFEYMTQHFVQPKHVLLGLNSDDHAALKSIDGQRKLLRKLTYLILPKRLQQITDLAIPSLHLFIDENNKTTKSHLVGEPKLPLNVPMPISANKTPLMHLATIHTDEFPFLFESLSPGQYLSFYIHTKDTEKRWPESPDDFKVYSYTQQNPLTAGLDDLIQPAVNVYGKLVLEIPGYQHCSIEMMDLEDEEQDQYEMLSTMYSKLNGSGDDSVELNKLFGYPDSIQNCVSYEAARIKHNAEYNQETMKKGTEWKLLLQISPYAHWLNFFDEFGDGTIYYMIHQDDLKAGNFENVQVVVQNT